MLVASFLLAPAVLHIPENSASAEIVYEDTSTVVDCDSFYYCNFYLSKSAVRALAHDYNNEIDLAIALTGIACAVATQKPVVAAVCSAIFEYVVKEHGALPKLRRIADDGQCASITYTRSSWWGFELVARIYSISGYDGEFCRA
jgi:hypothetical protein